MRRFLPLLLLLVAAPSFAVNRAAVITIRKQTDNGANSGAKGVQAAQIRTGVEEAVYGFIDHFNRSGYDRYVSNYRYGLSSMALGAQGVVGGAAHGLVVYIAPPNVTADVTTPFIRLDSLAYVLNGAASANATTPTAGYTTLVPQLIIDAQKGESNLAGYQGANKESFDPGNESPGYGGGRARLEGSSLVWGYPAGVQASVPDIRGAAGGTAAGAGVGGLAQGGDSSIRVIIGMHASNWCNAPFSAGRVPPTFRDSLYGDSAAATAFATYWGSYQTAFDTGAYGYFLWAGLGATAQDGRKPLIFCHHMSPDIEMHGGSSANTDSRVQLAANEILWAALSLADSMCSQCLLGGAGSPFKAAIQISRGISLGAAFSGGGWAPSDTSTQMQNVCDSLNALGVKITVGLNPDSLAFHAGMITNWKRIAKVKFAPEWAFDSSAAGGGNTSPNRPLDPLGIFRRRVSYGPNTGMASDTSRYALIARTYAIFDSAFGHSRVDHVWMGQSDDWSPAAVGLQNQAQMDSVYYVMALCGVRGVSSDAEADSEATATAGRGVPGGQRLLTHGVGAVGSLGRTPLVVLDFPGYNARGATRGNGRDSSITFAVVHTEGPNDSTFATHYMERSVTGLVLPYWYPPQDRLKLQGSGWTQGPSVSANGYTNYFGEYLLSGQISPKATTRTGVNLVRISASSLGSGEWGTTSPNMPGFYQIKYTVNSLSASNRLNTRSIFSFVYPEDIGPEDIRR